MKIKLTEEGLWVNKYCCRSVTVYRKGGKDFEAHLHNIKGITKRIQVICKTSGRHLTNWQGDKIYKFLKLRKKIKSKDFEYSGIPLKIGFSPSEKCYTAKNSKSNYINYYGELEK